MRKPKNATSDSENLSKMTAELPIPNYSVQDFSAGCATSFFYLCGRETKKIYLDSRNHSWKNHFGREESPFCKLKIFRNCYFLWLQN